MITFRLIADSELPMYATYMKRRSSESLNLYFGYAVSDYVIDTLLVNVVRSPHLHSIIVAENANNDIVGLVHIAHMRDDAVEFGVMVTEEYRGKGIASGMMDYAMTWSRNRGFRDLYMHCLSHNAPIKHLVQKHGLAISRDGTESDARVTLPLTDIFSVSHEIILRQQNAVNKSVNSTIQSFRRALAL